MVQKCGAGELPAMCVCGYAVLRNVYLIVGVMLSGGQIAYLELVANGYLDICVENSFCGVDGVLLDENGRATCCDLADAIVAEDLKSFDVKCVREVLKNRVASSWRNV